jgi:hypothetical protein
MEVSYFLFETMTPKTFLLLILRPHIRKQKNTKIQNIKYKKKLKKMLEENLKNIYIYISEKNIPEHLRNHRKLVEKDQNIQDWKI